MTGWFDPELEELFRGDPSLRQTAERVRAAQPRADADPHFRRRLRAELMVEAQRSQRPRSAWRRFGLGHLALAGATAGVVLAGATAVLLLGQRVEDHTTVVALSNLAAQHEVSPDDVITVSFNQPMDEQAVVAGLSIRPATQVTTAWSGNSLVITPVHHLAGNTPYTVAIAQPDLRTASGRLGTAPVEISFGTAPTPPPGLTGATPPALAPSSLGQAEPGSALLFAPDGSVVATQGLAPAPSPPAQPSSPSGSPTSSPTPTSASASPGAAGAALLQFPAGGGQPAQLAGSVQFAAFAPGGAALAVAVDDGNGGSQIVLSDTDGSQPTNLRDVPGGITGLTWRSSDQIVYATGDGVHHLDLSGTEGPSVAVPQGAGTITELAPGGATALLATGQGRALFDVATGEVRALPGTPDHVSFSGDGSTVAWEDSSSGTERLFSEPVDRATPAGVPTLGSGGSISHLTLNRDGSEIAYVVAPAAGHPELVVAQLASGAPLATGPPVDALAFSGDGALAFTVPGSGVDTVQLAQLPGAASAEETSGVPAAASAALRAFVQAQVRDDSTTLQTLSASDVDAASSTPPNLSRAYIVDQESPDGSTVDASVELIVDPSGSRTVPLVADERLTLEPAGARQQYLVTSLHASTLHPESAGPHVIQVLSGSAASGTTVLHLSFDSDLDPSTLASAVTVSDASGRVLDASVSYDAQSRTVVVTITQSANGPLQLTLATSLRDVDGNALAAAFSATVSTSGSS